MTQELDPQTSKFGPAIVSIANAARAFDAPVRYPIIFSAPFVGMPSMVFPRASAFLALVEHLFGILILAPILLITRGFKHIKEALKQFTKKDWLALIYVSAGGSALGLFFFMISFALGNPTVAILIQKLQPVITLAFAAVILKEKPSWQYYIALCLSLVGVFMISYDQIVGAGQTFDWLGLIAILCSLLAAILWGGSTVFGRQLTEKLHFWDLTLLRYIGGFFFLLVFNGALLTYNATYFSFLVGRVEIYPAISEWAWPIGSEAWFPNVAWNIPVIVGILYSALLTGGVLPLALYYFGLKKSKASIAGLAELAFPLLAIFVNYFCLGWGLTLVQGIGAGILLITVSLLSYINAKEMEKKQNNTKTTK